VYEYIVRDDDAWQRQNESPYATISPTESNPIFAQGTQVAVLQTVKDDKDKDVAMMQLKGETNTTYTTMTNLAKVARLSNEVEYAFSKDYQTLKLPYSKTTATQSYKQYEKANFHKACGDYLRVNTNSADEIEGYWALEEILREPVSDEEVELIDDYSGGMSSDVAGDYLGFVEDFKKGGYFTGDKEPLTWMEEQGLNENEITFLGMKVSKIITPFKEVLEETEKNLKNDYSAAYNEILEQYNGSSALLGQAQIRYIKNSCMCNPSNHSLGAAIDIRYHLNPQITSADKKYVTFIKYLTGLDLTKSKTAKQVTDAQEAFMKKLHGQKTNKYDLDDIIADYEDVNSMTKEFDQLIKLLK